MELVKVIIKEDVDYKTELESMGFQVNKEYYGYLTDRGVDITLDGLSILVENNGVEIVENTEEVGIKWRKLKDERGIKIKLVN